MQRENGFAHPADEYCSGELYCLNMGRQQRTHIAPFLQETASALHFPTSLVHLKRMPRAENAKILVWGARADASLMAFASASKIGVVRVTQGVLCADGLRPLALRLDDKGLQDDPHTPSALENWLNAAHLDASQRTRAQALQTRLVTLLRHKISADQAHGRAAGKPVIVVPGQVEDDALVRLGSPAIGSNAMLLWRVRRNHPHAHIVFLPHPDVAAGKRRGAVDAGSLEQTVDEVAPYRDIGGWIAQADAVHTMSSPCGFDALVQGKPVTCYGLPFYAGWGFTDDYLPMLRRRRLPDLATLVYGVLVAHSRYIDPHTLAPATVEQAVAALEAAL